MPPTFRPRFALQLDLAPLLEVLRQESSSLDHALDLVTAYAGGLRRARFRLLEEGWVAFDRQDLSEKLAHPRFQSAEALETVIEVFELSPTLVQVIASDTFGPLSLQARPAAEIVPFRRARP
jgi:hypothetical protein